MADPATYTLVIRPVPPKEGETPVEIRLRKFLKSLLRDLGFRCLDISQSLADQASAVTNHAPEKGADPEPEVY